MTMEKLGIKHMGLLLFGIIFLVIGLVASFYSNHPYSFTSITEYPYQTIGTILDSFGIIFIARACALLNERK